MNALALDLMLQTELPAATRGSQEAYGRIVHACQNTVTAIALAITRDVQASEDIAQEAFLKAWQQLDRLKNTASFLPWLRQITRNLARDWLRAQHGRPMSGEVAEIAIGMAADPDPTPAERLLQTEEEVVAADIISSLPEDSREALLLFYREGQSSQQVAELLGLSDAAVRKRLSRARALVREELLQRFGEFARSTAPTAAFTMIVLGGLVGAMPAASAATVIGSGVLGTGLLGKLGTGGLTTGGVTGGVAGGSLGVILEHVTHHPAALGGAVGGVIGGLIGYAFILVVSGPLLPDRAGTPAGAPLHGAQRQHRRGLDGRPDAGDPAGPGMADDPRRHRGGDVRDQLPVPGHPAPHHGPDPGPSRQRPAPAGLRVHHRPQGGGAD